MANVMPMMPRLLQEHEGTGTELLHGINVQYHRSHQTGLLSSLWGTFTGLHSVFIAHTPLRCAHLRGGGGEAGDVSYDE